MCFCMGAITNKKCRSLEVRHKRFLLKQERDSPRDNSSNTCVNAMYCIWIEGRQPSTERCRVIGRRSKSMPSKPADNDRKQRTNIYTYRRLIQRIEKETRTTIRTNLNTLLQEITTCFVISWSRFLKVVIVCNRFITSYLGQPKEQFSLRSLFADSRPTVKDFKNQILYFTTFFDGKKLKTFKQKFVCVDKH